MPPDPRQYSASAPHHLSPKRKAFTSRRWAHELIMRAATTRTRSTTRRAPHGVSRHATHSMQAPSRHRLVPPFEEDIWQYDPAPPGLPHPSAAPLTPADIFGHPASPPGAPLRMPPGPLTCTRRSTLPPRPSRVGQTRRKPGSLQPPSGLTQTHARQAGPPHARTWSR